MESNRVKLVFDRQKRAGQTGLGKIEARINLSRTCRKTIVVGEATARDWPKVSRSKEICDLIKKYERILDAMECLKEDMTIANLNKHLGITEKVVQTATPSQSGNADAASEASKKSFLDFMEAQIAKEKLADGTRRHKKFVMDALRAFGKIRVMNDLTATKLKDFDDWLRSNGERSDVTIYGYHKRLKKYVREAYQRGYIKRDPYHVLSITRGKCKERQPLTEEELRIMRGLKLRPKEARARACFSCCLHQSCSGFSRASRAFLRFSSAWGS